MLAWQSVKKPLSMLVLLLLMAPLAVSQQPASGSQDAEQDTGELELVDRIVAVVDEDPILESDVDRAIGLGLVSRVEDETDEAFRRRVLDLMIEERLRAHEVDRFGFTEISVLEVEKATRALEANFGSRQRFEERLQEIGLTREDVRQIAARQVMVVTYVDERLGPRVFVSLDDIRQYYETVLTPEMKRIGKPLPELDQVREQIRAVLREQRLNQEIERWTEQLRLEADIEDYFESAEGAPADHLIEARQVSE